MYTILIKPSSVIIYEPNNTCHCILLAFAPDYVLPNLGHFYDFDRFRTTYIKYYNIMLDDKYRNTHSYTHTCTYTLLPAVSTRRIMYDTI